MIFSYRSVRPIHENQTLGRCLLAFHIDDERAYHVRAFLVMRLQQQMSAIEEVHVDPDAYEERAGRQRLAAIPECHLRCQVGDLAASLIDGAHLGLLTERNAFCAHNGYVSDPEEAEDRAQVGFLMIKRLRRKTAARGGDDDLLASSQALRPVFGIAEGGSRHREAIDPGARAYTMCASMFRRPLKPFFARREEWSECRYGLVRTVFGLKMATCCGRARDVLGPVLPDISRVRQSCDILRARHRTSTGQSNLRPAVRSAWSCARSSFSAAR